jgi:putative ABC transport system ATP-binding protein
MTTSQSKTSTNKTPKGTAMIELTNVSKAYRTDTIETLALQKMNLTVPS